MRFKKENCLTKHTHTHKETKRKMRRYTARKKNDLIYVSVALKSGRSMKSQGLLLSTKATSSSFLSSASLQRNNMIKSPSIEIIKFLFIGICMYATTTACPTALSFLTLCAILPMCLCVCYAFFDQKKNNLLTIFLLFCQFHSVIALDSQQGMSDFRNKFHSKSFTHTPIDWTTIRSNGRIDGHISK